MVMLTGRVIMETKCQGKPHIYAQRDELQDVDMKSIGWVCGQQFQGHDHGKT